MHAQFRLDAESEQAGLYLDIFQRGAYIFDVQTISCAGRVVRWTIRAGESVLSTQNIRVPKRPSSLSMSLPWRGL